MSDEINEEESEETQPSAPSGPGLMTVVKAVAFLTVIVLLEVAAASMIIPSATETAQIAEKLALAEASDSDDETLASTDEDQQQSLPDAETLEVGLGAFHVLSYDPKTGSRLNVDFDLYGVVLAAEDAEFFELFAANERRIREQVLITVRGMDVTDLSDAGLGLIKRQILKKTNRALGKPLLHEAIFSKFSFVER